MSMATRGQTNRGNIRKAMENLLPKYLPNPLDALADYLAYELNLSPDTVKYTYLPMLVRLKILIPCGNDQYDLPENHPEKTESDLSTNKNSQKVSSKERQEGLTKAIERKIKIGRTKDQIIQDLSSQNLSLKEIEFCYQEAKNREDSPKET
jgi:hypothetical protein